MLLKQRVCDTRELNHGGSLSEAASLMQRCYTKMFDVVLYRLLSFKQNMEVSM